MSEFLGPFCFSDSTKSTIPPLVTHKTAVWVCFHMFWVYDALYRFIKLPISLYVVFLVKSFHFNIIMTSIQILIFNAKFNKNKKFSDSINTIELNINYQK